MAPVACAQRIFQAQKDINMCLGSNTGKWWINNETPYLTLDCLTHFLLIWLSDEFIIQPSVYVLLLSHVFISVPSKSAATLLFAEQRKHHSSAILVISAGNLFMTNGFPSQRVIYPESTAMPRRYPWFTLFFSMPFGPMTLSNIRFPTWASTALSGSSNR